MTGKWRTGDKTNTVWGPRVVERLFLLSDTITFLAVKTWPNECNMLVQHHPTLLVQHHPTLLNPTCCTRLATMLHDTLGPVVQKPINANPRLKINQGVYFSATKCRSKLIFGKTIH